MIKKTLIITLLFSLSLLANNTKNKIDLSNNNIKVVDENINILSNKTKKDYEKKPNLLEPVQKEKTIAVKKDDDITIDSDVDFDKSTKSVDGVKLNLGTKF
ncbi:hypothetical protein [Arcobacter sp. LA11]|uniref:hypothetical protein n=1 Tax=Arcobacter sp. LA11 TaxID=1898176 RepID=UPI0009354B67|nr:hypothetical protein [Arcobacter sp. LA11]